MKTRHLHKQIGFTLIEMIVSLGVFAVVVTITTGALLTLISSNQRFQNEQNVMTNLSFALDSMTRELRTGYNYYCVSQPGNFDSYDQEGLGAVVQSCPSGRSNNRFHGVSFYESGSSITGASTNRIMYFYDATLKKLYRKVGNNAAQSIVSDSIIIDQADFFVSFTGRFLATTGSDGKQPTITIQVKARPQNDTSATPKVYYVQSTITQRALDL